MLSRCCGGIGLGRPSTFPPRVPCGRGDYTRDRPRWLEGAAIQEIRRKSSAEAITALDQASAVRATLGVTRGGDGRFACIGKNCLCLAIQRTTGHESHRLPWRVSLELDPVDEAVWG